MAIAYTITSAITDGTTLTVGAKGCEQIGTRKGEHGNIIPIIRCRPVTVKILISDLPASNKLTYVKEQIETAYAALPDETVVKSLVDKKWTG